MIYWFLDKNNKFIDSLVFENLPIEQLSPLLEQTANHINADKYVTPEDYEATKPVYPSDGKSYIWNMETYSWEEIV